MSDELQDYASSCIKTNNCSLYIYSQNALTCLCFAFRGGNVVFVSSVAAYQPMQVSESIRKTIISNIFKLKIIGAGLIELFNSYPTFVDDPPKLKLTLFDF